MSYEKNGEVHIEDDEASAGEKTGHVRWILGISLVIAIALMSAIWIFGAFSQGDLESQATQSGVLEETVVEDDAAEADIVSGNDEFTEIEE